MVGKKSKIERGQSNSNLIFDNLIIWYRKNGGLGDPLSRAKNKKSVWEGREESTYQHPWTEGSQIRSYDLHQVKSRKGTTYRWKT